MPALYLQTLYRCFPGALLLVLLLCGLVLAQGQAEGSRIKDLTDVSGVRPNQLTGLGLITGLAGTGDSQIDFRDQAVANMLLRYGLTVDPDSIKTDNVAVVMITANIPAFARPGAQIDVTVSALGDAETLQGGTLLQTPLVGADGQVYAVAQGPIAIGGFLQGVGGPGGATVQQNHPTVGMIPGGAIVEREVPMRLGANNALEFMLLNPDFTSAVRVAEAINTSFPGAADPIDSTIVRVNIPLEFANDVPQFVSAIGQIDVEPDLTARVVINEKTGTIVATSNVRISTVAVSHGSLTITIARQENVSQPGPLSEGSTEVTESTNVTVTEVPGGFQVLPGYPTIERLTTALNALGVSTREMMSILQSLKKAGALQAELVLN
ncbi:MAG: flagellar basal body P-ring protein FlgI [Opitutales bacterium]